MRTQIRCKPKQLNGNSGRRNRGLTNFKPNNNGEVEAKKKKQKKP